MHRSARLLLPLLLAGCGPTHVLPPGSGQPPDPALAQAIVDSTALRRPLHLIFAWNFTEAGARFSGRGSTRVQQPHYARLDLFGPRGETYLSAAAVGDELILPPNLPSGMRSVVPPIALLWSALGVVRQPEGSVLAATALQGDTATLSYRRGDESWRFRIVGNRLQYVEWNGPNAGRRTVELRGEGAHNLPAVAVYRDWAAFRELTLTLEQANEVDFFPPQTWDPGS